MNMPKMNRVNYLQYKNEYLRLITIFRVKSDLKYLSTIKVLSKSDEKAKKVEEANKKR